MGQMEEASAREKADKGWSRWEIMALGADHTLIPEIGRALDEQGDGPDAYAAAQALQELAHDGDYDTLEEERAAYVARDEEARKALTWLQEHPEVALSLKSPEDFCLFPVLGEAMIYFGKNTIGFPPRGAYGVEDSDEGFARWKQDVQRWGTVLAEKNEEEFAAALEWLKDWYGDLWD